MQLKEMAIKTEIGNSLKWNPKVVIDHKLNRKMELIIDLIDTEVGWYGLVEWQKPDIFKVKDIYLLKQEVTGTFTEIDAMALCDLEDELEKKGLLKDDQLDTTGLYLWGHSHVNMAPSPSGTDTDTMKKICERSRPPFFIRLIQNKKGDRTVTLYIEDKNSLVQDYALIYNVPWVETEDLGEEDVRNDLEKEIKEKVKARYVAPVATTIRTYSATKKKVEVDPLMPDDVPPVSESNFGVYGDYTQYDDYHDIYDTPESGQYYYAPPKATVKAASSEVRNIALNRLHQRKFGLPSRG